MSEIEVKEAETEVEEAEVAVETARVDGFEPKIVAFCCHYCAYTAADLAGSMRLQYPPNVRVVRLLCTGKSDPIFFLKAFEGGADGVFVAGCMEGDCHFLQGNYRAKKRVRYTQGLLEEAGIGRERLEFFNMSAGEGTKFAAAAKEMTARIKGLGPSPINAPKGHLEKTIEKIEQTVEKP
jgi:F420-non-reducing hydrogenase iron-sulfur subunit